MNRPYSLLSGCGFKSKGVRMPTPVNISLNTFLSAAESASSDTRTVKVSGNTAKAVWYHTFQSTNRQSMTQFINAIAKEYGQDVANIASRKLQRDLDSSRPLTAGLIKSTMAEVQKHSHKQLARDLFLMGMDEVTGMASTDTGFSVTFEKSCKHIEDSIGTLSSDTRDALKNAVYQQFETTFKNVELHSCSQEEMEKFITASSILGKISSLHKDGVLNLPGSADDKVSLVLTLAQNGISAAHGFALQKLGDIRSQFPDGPLSMSQIWQGCFNSEMSVTSDDRDTVEEAFKSNVAKSLGVPDFPGARNSCLNLTSVMPLASVAQFASGQLNAITLDSFFAPPKVSFSPWSSRSGMDALKADAHRVFASMPYPKSMGLPSYKVTPYIQTGSNKAVDIGIRTESSKRGEVAEKIQQEVLAECRGNQKQADSVLHLCTQAALAPFFGLGSGLFAGGGEAPFRHLIVNEHYASWTTIDRQENGDVTVQIKTPDNEPSVVEHIGKFSSTITVHPDGSCEYTDFNLQLTAPQQ